jgi:ATP-dependent Zn protease
VRAIISGQSERARHLLTEHRPTLDRIVAALLDCDRLLGHELLALFPPRARA